MGLAVDTPTSTRIPKTRATFIQSQSAAWNTFHLVELAEADALAQIARDEVQARILTELTDTNKLLRDQNRMMGEVLQARKP